MFRSCYAIVAVAFALIGRLTVANAFVVSPAAVVARQGSTTAASTTTAVFMSDDFAQESSVDTQERIQALVENHPVLLFMKGSKLFPQCGFSNTAVQILESFKIDFHTVDVLADEAVRSGVKDFSQWPTIPQLYVCGEFVGGKYYYYCITL